MPKMVDDDFDEGSMFAEQSPIVPVGNPLGKYFRLPGLSVSLPTGGAFFPKGGIELDQAGEVSILPMRAQDELLLNSPDSLMNNSAIVGLIKSCVPAIKMPELVSAPDLDVLLLAIRVASSGEKMEVELTCAECNKPTTFEIDIPAVLSTVKPIPSVLPLRLSPDVILYMKPHTVATQTKVLISAFRETRNAQAIAADESLSDEERGVRLGAIMEKLGQVNLYGVAHSIIKAVVPGAEVTDINYILEFLANTDKKTMEKIRIELERINSMGIDKTVDAVCQHCKHEWQGTIEFNPANFFEDRSSD